MPTELEETTPWYKLDLEHDETLPWPRMAEVDDPGCDTRSGVDPSIHCLDEQGATPAAASTGRDY